MKSLLEFYFKRKQHIVFFLILSLVIASSACFADDATKRTVSTSNSYSSWYQDGTKKEVIKLNKNVDGTINMKTVTYAQEYQDLTITIKYERLAGGNPTGTYFTEKLVKYKATYRARKISEVFWISAGM